jgi:4-nitrophenyl phosphatase
MISEQIDGLLCDLDGVVYRGDQPIAGAPEAIVKLRRRGVKIVFCTNNSRSTVAQYVEKLARVGVEATAHDILTSGLVTADVLAARGFSGRRAIVVGGEGVSDALLAAGISIDDDPSSTAADLVVVGWDPDFDYVAMRRAATAVRGGATFVATNSDATFPAPDGLWPGAGAILASIEVAAGRPAEVMGKPYAPTMDAAARRLAGAAHIAAIGDRPDTDLAGGAARGWATILVLSGVTSKEEVPRISPPPDLVLNSIAELPDALGG